MAQMMASLQNYAQKAGLHLRMWQRLPAVHIFLRGLGHFAGGFLLSAADLGGYYLPLSMGWLLACRGWGAVLAALGGCLGYFVFWGTACQQAYFWLVMALPVSLLLGDRRISNRVPWLIPTQAGFLVAAGGVLFQILLDTNEPVLVYLLQVGLALGSTRLFTQVLQGRNPILDWLAGAIWVLSLCQIAPTPYLNPGIFAAGLLSCTGAFPAAALSGLALDLGRACPVPMTAVLTLGYLVRFFPRCPKGVCAGMLGIVYAGMMVLCNVWYPYPLPALVLGGIVGSLLPLSKNAYHRRGETGVAQVRLEMASGVLSQTRQLLMDVNPPDIDEDALVARAADRACSHCNYRKACKDSRRIGQLSGMLLHKSLLSSQELPITCRKSGRFLSELHRAQEQLRAIRADRERQAEYRSAVVQQYRFLSEFLQDLSDNLAKRPQQVTRQYTPLVSVFGNRPEADNGDRCLYFAGTGSKYYVLLCDGMGTGMGAVREGKAAGQILQQLLGAGFPAQYALRSLNSLCALRDRAGAVTIDLAEILLESGKVTLYKWGAAPSYLISKEGAERIGQAGPPPGICVDGARESIERLSLRQGQWLVLVSDGVDSAQALVCCMEGSALPVSELATRILHGGHTLHDDDATVAIIRLSKPQT